jgi:high-affinity iron transporter
LYATWEGILFQAAAALFVIGSYVLAEYLHKRARLKQTPAATPHSA